jgi:3'(2'), 5'-bisphosphate nucleotidase
MLFEKELQVALEAAWKAGELILRDYAAFIPIPNAPASISTDTDRNSQEVILQNLQAAFPDDALCAEESTPTLLSARRTGPRIWIVDPIDGTRGFAMKNGEFSVMIGLVEDGQIAVGVVLEPVQDRITYATRGSGCWARTSPAQPRACRVTDSADLGASTLVQSHSKPGVKSKPVDAIQPATVMEMYSAGVKLALVARGEADLYVNWYPRVADWDICAGHLLVTEAGGLVTTLSGQEVRYCQQDHAQKGGLLATNGRVHNEAVRLLRA